MWIQATDLKFYSMPYFSNNEGAVAATDILEVISYSKGVSFRSLLLDLGIKGKLTGGVAYEKNLHATRGLIDCRVSELTLREVTPIPEDYSDCVEIPNWDSTMVGFRTWHCLPTVREYIDNVSYDYMLTRIMTGSPFGECKLARRRLLSAMKTSTVSNGKILLEWKNEVRSSK